MVEAQSPPAQHRYVSVNTAKLLNEVIPQSSAIGDIYQLSKHASWQVTLSLWPCQEDTSCCSIENAMVKTVCVTS